MIQFGSANLLVETATGQTREYDLDALQERLDAAFQQHGIHEGWLAENLVLSLEEKIRSSNSIGKRLQESELEQMLLNVLLATGYAEIANEYLRLSQQDFILQPQGMRSWSPAELQVALSAGLPISGSQAETLAQECLKALQKLGFDQVSDAFVRELAVHLLHFRVQAEQQPEEKPAARKTQFIGTTDWLRLAGSKASELIKLKILQPMPLSDIFPTARLQFRLRELAQWQGDWSAELNLLPALPEIAFEILTLLDDMRGYIRENWPRISEPATHLILPGFRQFFMKEIPGLKRKQREELQEQVRLEVQRLTREKAAYELMLSFR
ncbi:MAG: hypothetical protein GX946_06825 [Oligosphaeraceae bacterium]|nr:hypothetical protein [Oligosphaeraceae bacterium]